MGKRKADEEDLEAADKKECVDLYQVLGVEPSATDQEIRKAYHKLALRLHPDKNPGDKDAKNKFQSLQDVITILGDPKKREVYDRTGSTEDVEFMGDSMQDWRAYFRHIYDEITEEKIEKFAAAYKATEEEEVDLKRLYTQHKGNMNRVFLHLLCSEPEQDSHRFKDIIDEAIAAGELKDYKAYRIWAKEISKRPAPKLTKKRKAQAGPASDLVVSIQRNAKKMDSLAAALEAKYSSRAKGKYKEPSEEEFEAAQKKLHNRNSVALPSKDRKRKGKK